MFEITKATAAARRRQQRWLRCFVVVVDVMARLFGVCVVVFLKITIVVAVICIPQPQKFGLQKCELHINVIPTKARFAVASFLLDAQHRTAQTSSLLLLCLLECNLFFFACWSLFVSKE